MNPNWKKLVKSKFGIDNESFECLAKVFSLFFKWCEAMDSGEKWIELNFKMVDLITMYKLEMIAPV